MIYTLVAIFSNDKILQSIKLTFIIVLIRLRRGSKFIYKERDYLLFGIETVRYDLVQSISLRVQRRDSWYGEVGNCEVELKDSWVNI